MRSIAGLLLVLLSAAYSHDFKQYTVIDTALRDRLLSNRNRYAPVSGYAPGNVAVFGNSITQPNSFWKPFGDPFVDTLADTGVVPGTNWESYIVNKTNMYYCAVSGYTIGNGLDCIDTALGLLKPEVAVCMYGTNDMWHSDTAMFKAGYRTYLQKILDRGAIPLVCTIPPVTYNDQGNVAMYNRAIKELAAEKQVVLVDYWQAVTDYAGTTLTAGGQWYEDAVHPSSCTVPELTDIVDPGCGQGIHNAVVWEAVNKVYREIIDLDTGVKDGPVTIKASDKANWYISGGMLIVENPEGHTLRLCTINGVSIYKTRKYSAVFHISGCREGIYILTGGSVPQAVYIHK